MQWMTEDCTSRANTGWRKKMWWDELEGRYSIVDATSVSKITSKLEENCN